MVHFIGKKKQNEHPWVCKALKKGENPLSEEEVDFIQTCRRILKVSEGN
jgi:hypothetical protein